MNYFDFNKSLIPIQIEVDLVKVNEKTSGLYDLNIKERHFDKGELSGGIGDGMGRYGKVEGWEMVKEMCIGMDISKWKDDR